MHDVENAVETPDKTNLTRIRDGALSMSALLLLGLFFGRVFMFPEMKS